MQDILVAETEIQIIPPIRRLTEEEVNKVKYFGANAYDSRRCYMLLGWTDFEYFARCWNDTGSEFRYYYELGLYEAEFKEDMKNLELGFDGDLAAQRERRKRIEQRKNDNQ